MRVGMENRVRLRGKEYGAAELGAFTPPATSSLRFLVDAVNT